MKKLLLLPLLLFFCATSHAQIARVTTAGHKCSHENAGTGETSSCVIDNTSGVGNMLVFGVHWCGNSACGTPTTGDTISVADGNGAATCVAGSRNDSAVTNFQLSEVICYVNNIASNASNTVTATCTHSDGHQTNYCAIWASEWSGQKTSSVTDQSAIFAQFAPSSPATMTSVGATSFANEMVYTLWASGGTFAAGSGYTEITHVGNNLDEYKIVSAAGSQSATVTWGGGGTQSTVGSMVTFVAASQPSTFVPQVGGFFVGP